MIDASLTEWAALIEHAAQSLLFLARRGAEQDDPGKYQLAMRQTALRIKKLAENIP